MTGLSLRSQAALRALAAAAEVESLKACMSRHVVLYHYTIDSIVVPFCGLQLGSYKVIPKRNYYGASGHAIFILHFHSGLVLQWPWALRRWR